MKSTFLLEIVTPERVAYSEEVDMVVVPGSNGYLGILAHHVPLFAQLIEGEVKIVKQDEEYFLSIGGGFIEVSKEKTTILVTKAYHADELNEKEILKAKGEAERILKEKPVGEDLEAAHRILRSTLVDLKVVRRRRRRSSTPAS